MNGKQLERSIAAWSPIGATHLDHIGRALRAAGLLPTGGRGLTAPQLDARDVANFMIAVAIGDAPLASAQKVAAYRAAPASWSGILNADMSQPPVEAFAGCETFGEALEALLSRLVHEAPLLAVEIVREWPRAEIILKDGRRFFYGVASMHEARDAGISVWPIKSKTVLPASILSQLSLELSERDEKSGALIWGDER